MQTRNLAQLMLAVLSAATLLAAASAASHGAAGTMTWTELAYPTVEADMHKVLTSPSVTIDSSTDVDVGYIKFYRSGDVIGEGRLDCKCISQAACVCAAHDPGDGVYVCRS